VKVKQKSTKGGLRKIVSLDEKMRHQTKKHTLGKAQDQRKALLRSLATELFTYGEIKTTMARAKALRPYAEEVITLAKRGDLHARRHAAKFVFDKEIEQNQTVLRKLFAEIGTKYSQRAGGYTRIYRLPPRRGDASEMALIQLV
jgi:large subunit ribosomal protein L17